MTRKRIDVNQIEIVAALRAAGVIVIDLHEIGHGVHDLLICFQDGMDYYTGLAEIKSPDGEFTADEIRFQGSWPGLQFIFRSPEDALRLIGKIK